MSVTTSKNGVGVALRSIRKLAGMTLDDVSRAAGVSAPYLSNVENGNVTPSPGWVHTVLEVIGKEIAA
jgi:transcriptional regulator with XRE-family HTH domain